MTRHEKRAQVQRLRGKALAILKHYEEHLEAMKVEVAQIMEANLNSDPVDDAIDKFLTSPGDQFDYAMMLMENRLDRAKRGGAA